MDTTFCLVYCSQPTSENVLDDLGSILIKSQHNNKRMDITGLLLFNQTYYVQLLEGEKHEIFRLYETIMKDSRHDKPVILFQDYVEKRFFPQWNLAFAPLNDIQNLNIPQLIEEQQSMSANQLNSLLEYAKELI